MRNGLFIVAVAWMATGMLFGAEPAAGPAAGPAAEPAGRPNILFILTDDQSYGSMGVSGNRLIQTPHLDQLARDGIFFTNAHVTSAICTPSRISYFLSQFERKHGVNFNSGTSVSGKAWQDAYPVLLRKAGYYTGYVGKNHAPVGNGGYGSGHMEKSFDYWYAGHGHLRFYPKEVHEIFNDARASTQVEVLQEGALDFLNENAFGLKGAMHFLDKRPDDKPFCLSICFNLPHTAGTSTMEQRESDPEIYRTLYRDLEIPLPDHYIAKDQIKTPKLPPEIHRAADRQTSYDYVDQPGTVKEMITRTMQAMTGIDLMVGKLRSRLEELGLDDNTVIVFSSDHGLYFGQHGLGGKALCYEVCTHVPLIIYDPTLVQDPATGGKKGDPDTGILVQSIDVAPTLLDYAGLEIPATYQGKSLKPVLKGKKKRVREYLFTENLWSTHFGNPRCESVQNRRWKYIRYYENNNISVSYLKEVARTMGIPQNKLLYGIRDPQIAVYRSFIEGPLDGEPAVYEELYDLETDPGECFNLASDPAHSGKLERMRKVWYEMIREARGTGQPAVVRYTVESQQESTNKR